MLRVKIKGPIDIFNRYYGTDLNPDLCAQQLEAYEEEGYLRAYIKRKFSDLGIHVSSQQVVKAIRSIYEGKLDKVDAELCVELADELNDYGLVSDKADPLSLFVEFPDCKTGRISDTSYIYHIAGKGQETSLKRYVQAKLGTR